MHERGRISGLESRSGKGRTLRLLLFSKLVVKGSHGWGNGVIINDYGAVCCLHDLDEPFTLS